MADLNIAEIPYEDGSIKCRYSRRLSEDGLKWIREGLFVSYYPNGIVASEGNYVNGLEGGLWRDYHPDGSMAAEGFYRNGKEIGEWKFWNLDGSINLEKFDG